MLTLQVPLVSNALLNKGRWRAQALISLTANKMVGATPSICMDLTMEEVEKTALSKVIGPIYRRPDDFIFVRFRFWQGRKAMTTAQSKPAS